MNIENIEEVVPQGHGILIYNTPPRDNISMRIYEISYKSAISPKTETSSEGGQSKLSESVAYYNIRDEFNDKFMLKQILQDATYDSHEEYLEELYSFDDLKDICYYYGLNYNERDSKKELMDNVIYYELDSLNFDEVWERYNIWKKLMDMKNNPKMYGLMRKMILRDIMSEKK